MSLTEILKLERYRLVTDRQRYFTELARGAFASYMKVFTGLVAGGIALISAKERLGIEPQLLSSLLDAVAYLVTLLAIVAVVQILFCLLRWKGYRKAEREVNPDSPTIKWWWWIFEALYVAAIAVSLWALWKAYGNIAATIAQTGP